MTREEATKWLKTFKGRTGMAELSQAFDVAIQALEQEPCEDCVNRQAVLNTLFYKSDNNCEVVLNKELQDRIKALPSVTPQPFINKPCVSEGVCREDKMQVLDKIRAEIDGYCSDNRDRNDGLYIAMRIIDKHLHEIESEVGKYDKKCVLSLRRL